MAATTVATGVPATGSLMPAVKESALAALVTFVLLGPLLGMRTASGPTGMTLDFHFGWVFLAAALVFAGRMVMATMRGRASPVRLPTAGLVQVGKAIAAHSYWLA